MNKVNEKQLAEVERKYKTVRRCCFERKQRTKLLAVPDLSCAGISRVCECCVAARAERRGIGWAWQWAFLVWKVQHWSMSAFPTAE